MKKNRKQQIISGICFLIGFGIVCLSIQFQDLRPIIHFAGAMMITGSFIFWDGWVVQAVYKEKAYLWKAQNRLLGYSLLGTLLLKIPVAFHAKSYPLMITKAFGMALLLLAMWKFYSFTTRFDGRPTRKVGCEGTGDCANCGKSDICSTIEKKKQE